MPFRELSFLLAAAGLGCLAVLSFARIRESRLARALFALSTLLAGLNSASYLTRHFASDTWHRVDATLTALAPALLLYFVLTYVGRVSWRHRAFQVCAVYFGLLALSSALVPRATLVGGVWWLDSSAWAATFLLGWLPTFAFEAYVLIRHWRREVDALEVQRSMLVLAAVMLGGMFASTDLVADLNLETTVPALGPLGTLVSAAVLAYVALRKNLFDYAVSEARAVYTVAMSVVLVGTYVLLHDTFQSQLTAYILGCGLVTCLGALLVRESVLSSTKHAKQQSHLLLAGRMSAQVMHDLKNPLTAVLGAVQVLEGARGEEAREFHALITEQAKRMQVILSTYDRMGNVAAVRTVCNVVALAEGVARSFEARVGSPVSVAHEGVAREIDLDVDLLASALENLVSNAAEATAGSGEVGIGIVFAAESIQLTVHDTGPGMNARQAAMAFDDFYTTKATGSGLGLAFVKRIAEAHGGTATIQSTLGKGTRVRLIVPG
jgi:two-component system, NtrC family, sensor histidine kinase HydH